ncbi:MAG: hypothetical protein JWL59_2233, partial [Chthoniobacteraceae bacterium]|nr:hypothetical protein [Chthoniobacteraceae bacterium]
MWKATAKPIAKNTLHEWLRTKRRSVILKDLRSRMRSMESNSLFFRRNITNVWR